MALSQNGWTAVQSGTDKRLVPLAQITGRVLAGDVNTVLSYLAEHFNAHVEQIDKASSWGHAYRAVTGGSSLSNHSSGTAVDFNAPRHPLGKSGTFNAAQVNAIRTILATINQDAQVVRWGGDYSGRKDEMHFEIVGAAAQVAAAARRLSGGAPAASTTAGGRDVAQTIATQKAVHSVPADGYWGDDTDNGVNIVRAALNGQKDRQAQVTVGADPDGIWGSKSEAALIATVKKLQTAWGVKADGIWGPDTEAAYKTARARNYKTW